jgi:hypothetical protein
LAEFQLHRRIHGIIGLFDSAEARKLGSPTEQALADAVDSFHAQLKQLPTTTATKVYGFDPDPDQLVRARSIEGLVMIPGTGDIDFFLNTVLADFASEVLREFSNMVRI